MRLVPAIVLTQRLDGVRPRYSCLRLYELNILRLQTGLVILVVAAHVLDLYKTKSTDILAGFLPCGWAGWLEWSGVSMCVRVRVRVCTRACECLRVYVYVYAPV